MPVKIKDIAQELGLSNATVFHGHQQQTRHQRAHAQAVLKKLVECGYRDALMQKMPIGALHEIAFVVCKKHGKVVGDTQFFSRIIEELSAPVGMRVMFFRSHI